MNKMTAVEWLIEELKKPYSDIYMNDILIKAKEMEKEQMQYFGAKCCLMTKQKNQWTLEELYNETFKKTN